MVKNREIPTIEQLENIMIDYKGVDLYVDCIVGDVLTINVMYDGGMDYDTGIQEECEESIGELNMHGLNISQIIEKMIKMANCWERRMEKENKEYEKSLREQYMDE